MTDWLTIVLVTPTLLAVLGTVGVLFLILMEKM